MKIRELLNSKNLNGENEKILKYINQLGLTLHGSISVKAKISKNNVYGSQTRIVNNGTDLYSISLKHC